MSQQTKIILGFATIYLVWGSTYLAIRLGVETMPPFLMAGGRFIIGGLMLYGWARFNGIAKPKPAHLLPALILGFLMPLGGAGMVTWAETLISSGLAALLVAMVPLWIALIDWLRPGGSRPQTMTTIGLYLGFIGMALLILPSISGQLSDVNPIGALIIVGSSLSWAIGSIYSKQARQPKSKTLGTGMQMLAGGVGLMIASGLTGEFQQLDLSAISLISWASFTYLALIGSVTFAVYIWLLSKTSASKVATYAYVNPIIAMILGAMFAGESFSAWTLFCSVIVIGAVVLVIMSKGRSKNESPEHDASTDAIGPAPDPALSVRCQNR